MSSSGNVRQNYEQGPIYEQFTEEHDLFKSKQDLFVFSACVGYANGECRMTDYTGEGEMLWMHFSNKPLYKAVAASIAYQHHDDPEALLEPEMQLETLAMYAAGGADLLDRKFGDIKGDPTDAVLNYIQEWEDQEPTKARQTVLDDIMESFETGPKTAKES